ncbi:MAG: hypothetical protein V9F05_14480 [Chitinophagaceae bacterium]
MRIFIYCIVFTSLVRNTVIGQIIYPNTFDHSYKSKFSLNYDSIKQINEFVYYCTDTALLSTNFVNLTIESEFKPMTEVLITNGVVSKVIHYNMNTTDTIHYLYKASQLISSYHASAFGRISDSIYFRYHPYLIKQLKGGDTTEYCRIFEYDFSDVLVKEKIYKNNETVAIIDYFFSDTLDITTFKFVPDTICFKQIIIKEYDNNLTFNEQIINSYKCIGNGQASIQYFIYNEFNNVIEIQTYFNGELNGSEKYYYFLNYGLIFAVEEISQGLNKITKYVIN